MTRHAPPEPATELIYGPSEALLTRYTLRCVSGQAEPELAELGASSLSVGQSQANALCVSDPSVSRFHFEIAREQGHIVLRDLDSTNGTRVEGVSVQVARLAPGQHIRAGRSEFVLEAEQEACSVEASPSAHFGALVGGSEPMRVLYAMLGKAAASEATVLLLGESGTGKELVAEELHRHSPRAAGPLIVVDCGALPEELIESELFGHLKGAFTGASSDRQGAFEAASGGTLFLDEIGELPLALQPKLLRVLESRTIKRIGDNTRRPVDVRFVAATNRNLRAEVNAGAFREDLFWRLSVVELRIPPLRERREDIPALVEALWQRSGLDEAGPGIDQATLSKLVNLPWRGNVRELRNFVERSAVFGAAALPSATLENPALGSAREGPQVQTALPFREAKEAWVQHFERSYLEERLVQAEGNMSRLAREAAMDRAHLLKLLRKHGLR